MKHLPPYWAIKIDKEHPLWERFFTYIEENFEFEYREFDNYDYVAKDEDTNVLDFCNTVEGFYTYNKVELITLEQFFGETQFEIY